ncbi:hypothetical protein MHC_01055 [Mycoplasma haemocanis str. Illinois]|uniref:Uncharacterized protein n=1 Tax=Mycoplasma haemocanis (strain Illinois) TaxID=1111676 RepID=H6N605_MYCHN|nr:hypothetical protein [Mycoplasma haemocanis]AEW45077.1 hypothetical protein MHC_01055 [Mycoplasma haemocanis str. Illinois]
MPSSLLTKATLGTLGVGTVATGSIYLGKDLIVARNQKTKTSIEELIETVNPDKRFISRPGTSSHWRAVWSEYKKDNNVWNLAGLDTTTASSTEDAPQEFMDACDSKKEQEVLDKGDSLYSQVVKYCTRNTLVRDLINETEGKTLLTKGSDFATNQDWKTVWELYKQDNNGKNTDSWDIGSWSSNKDSSNVPDAFATKCGTKSEVEEYQLDQSNYLDVLKYCTKVG